MNIKIMSKDGITLKTKDTYIREDISVAVDESLMGITPTGTYEVVENGEYDITEYAKVNVNVLTGGGEEGELPTDLSYMFNNNSNITSLDKFCIDWYKYTSNATTMRSMFYGCSNLTAIPKLNTSNMITCISMFYGCSKLTTIQSLDLKNVDNMQSVFYGCSNLTAIPKLSTPKVTQFVDTFYNCKKLSKIDISHFNISNHYSGKIYSQNMCANCFSLKTIIIRSFGSSYLLDTTAFNNCYHLTGAVNSTYNPDGLKDGYIYVPRNMCDTLKSATNWSTYADQIRALEDYTVDGTTTGELDESKI